MFCGGLLVNPVSQAVNENIGFLKEIINYHKESTLRGPSEGDPLCGKLWDKDSVRKSSILIRNPLSEVLHGIHRSHGIHRCQVSGARYQVSDVCV